MENNSEDKRYESYKDSGVAWIGEIPSEWNLVNAKRLLKNEKRIVGSKADSYERLALTLNGVIKRSKDDNEGLQPEKFEGYQILNENELVFKLIDLQNISTSRVGLSPYQGLVSPAYIVLKNKRNESNKYFYYWYMNMYYTCVFNNIGGDGVRSAINAQDLLALPIPNISLAEQHRIATFLDSKSADIDALISLQEQMIEELKAYKQSVITEAVTKGLDPNAKMKDSGVEWIGEIPEEWEVKILKRIISENLKYGANESGVIYDTKLPRYVRITDILDNNLRNDIQMLSLTEEQSNGFILKNNDILFARSGGTVGKAFIYKEQYGRCAFAGYLIKASIDKNNDAKFVYYYTQSSSYEEWKRRIFIRATIQNIGADKYSIMEISLPPLSVQRSIAAYLDEKTSQIDELIALKNNKIEELKEYKKSVIFEYVTGKKKV